MTRSTSLLVAILASLLSLPALAGPPSPGPPLISVRGDAEAEVAPDLAKLAFSVTAEGKDASEAARRNAEVASRVLEALQRELGKHGTAETAGYRVEPQYRYQRDSAPVLLGYRATHRIAVETGVLDAVGNLIDSAMEAGAPQVDSLQFALRDETEARAALLATAAKRARTKASAIADALGVRIVRVHRVSEGGAQAGPRPMAARAMAEGAMAQPTPIEAGTLTLRARVDLELEIAE